MTTLIDNLNKVKEQIDEILQQAEEERDTCKGCKAKGDPDSLNRRGYCLWCSMEKQER